MYLQQLLILIVLCLSVGSGVANTAFSAFFNELRSCLLDKNVTPGSYPDETVRVMLAASQTAMTFERVMGCVEAKLQRFHTESTVTQRFLKEMFDATPAKNYSYIANTLYKSVPADDWGCMHEAGGQTVFDHCLQSTELEQYSSHGVVSNCILLLDSTKQCVVTATMSGSNCAKAVAVMATIFTDMMFGKCSSIVQSTTSPPVTSRDSLEYSYTTPDFTYYDYMWRYSAFVDCGQVAYSEEPLLLTSLFPPSEYSWTEIQQAPSRELAKNVHKQSLEAFCSNITSYSKCVGKRLSANAGRDGRIGLFVDGKNFGNVMTKYCANADLISSQFDCMVDAVSQTTCNGGILDILQSILKMMRTEGIGSSCSDIYKNKHCRVEKQLKKCDPQFASVMSSVIDGLLTSDCKEGGYVVDKTWTETLPCFVEYSAGIIQRAQVMSRKMEMGHSTAFVEFLNMEMEMFCPASDDMLTCMEQKISVSKKPVDVMIKKFISMSNLKKTIQFGCSTRQLYIKHSHCVMEKLMMLFAQKTTTICMKTGTEQFTSELKELQMNSTSILADKEKMDDLSGLICRSTKFFGECLKPSFSACDVELGETFEMFVSHFHNSCSNPNFVVEGHKGDRSSAVGVLPSLATLLISLVALAQ